MPAAAIPDFIHESVRTLPVLPTAVTRLMSLARDVDADFREIARVIETDQTLTARTLRAANSPLNSVSRQVKTVRQATVLLGTDTIVNLALGVSVISLQSGLYKNLPVDPKEFGRHSIAVGLAARALAQHFKLPNSSEAFVAGLLHDIGKLVLLMHYGEAYAQLMRQSQQEGKPLNELELDAYDLDHALVGHVLCMHWNLPSTMAQAVAEHHAAPAPRSVADVVSRANDLVKTIQLGDSGNRYVALAPASGLPRDQISRDVLREMVLTLPRLTHEAEEALGHSDNGVAAETPTAERPCVHLHFRESDEKEILTAMLWSMGYEPIGTHEAAFAGNGLPDSAAPIALLSSVPAAEMQSIVHQQRTVPVLDYASWRTQHNLSLGIPFDVYQLRTWLEAGLQEATNQT
ncbi:MAG: HDOD domain-containing protein [Bacteroidetes bacterium]|nr:HDOD domain-containing protein [Bacteroidota bacterium]